MDNRTFRNVRKHVLLFSLQNKGWYGVFPIEENELVCAISRKFVVGRKESFVSIKGS